MDNSIYTMISRQTGLSKELSSVANNIANANTSGFKKEGAIFSEYVRRLQGGDPSMSIGQLGAHFTDFSAGTVRKTGGSFDVAIDGQGFFLIESDAGPRLSRAGHFLVNAESTLVNSDGLPVLDSSGGRIQIPVGASNIAIAGDGTISSNGEPVGKIGIVTADPISMERIGANLWHAKDGFEPDLESRAIQGFIEGSNVQPVEEMARLVEVQRNYEMGQSIMEREDERIKQVVEILRRTP